MSRLGDNIKRIRIDKGLTQEELAAAVGTTKSTISKYELGRREPGMDTLERIAKALSVDVGWLVGKLVLEMPEYPSHIPTQEEVEHMAPVEQEYRLLRLLADDSPDDLKKKLTDSYDKLNKLGRVEAVRRTQELTKLVDYTQPDPNNKPAVITLNCRSTASTETPPGASQDPPGDEESR